MKALWTLSAALCMELWTLGVCWASPTGSGLDLISCMSTTDERLAECDVRGFSIADPDVLEDTLSQSHFELDSQERDSVPKRAGFWGSIRQFSKFVYRGFRHYFVPKARAFLCMDQEDEHLPPPCMTRQIAWAKTYPALSQTDFQIDPSWAFGHPSGGDESDARARAWQRGHDRVTTPISLEPDLKTDQYGMSLDVRF